VRNSPAWPATDDVQRFENERGRGGSEKALTQRCVEREHRRADEDHRFKPVATTADVDRETGSGDDGTCDVNLFADDVERRPGDSREHVCEGENHMRIDGVECDQRVEGEEENAEDDEEPRLPRCEGHDPILAVEPRGGRRPGLDPGLRGDV